MLRGKTLRLVALAAAIGLLSLRPVDSTARQLRYGVVEFECDFPDNPDDWRCDETGVVDCYNVSCPPVDGITCCRVHD